MKGAKAIVIAGLSGGSGKSVVSVGLVAAWAQAGRIVAPFKKGPDYIDAGWLQCAAGRNCYNLDPYLVADELILASFRQRSTGVELVVIEGNRGLYDGVTAQGGYSTAELAITLDVPVLLVINCTKTTRTVAAMVLGCLHFDTRLKIGGVILNQVATTRQEKIITEAIEHSTGIEVVGVVPRLKTDIFPMRHLGMIPHQEYEGSGGALELLARTARHHIDMERVQTLMGPVMTGRQGPVVDLLGMPTCRDVKIAVLRDAAFQFYYPENLAALERLGAELVPVDALYDARMPDVDGLYIGGGFPETSAARLAANESFRLSVRQAAESGLPIYAECGGLIYLGSSFVLEGGEFALVGIFPIRFGMSRKPQAHGYSVFTVEKQNPFYPVGLRIKGHEFRYSTILSYQGASGDLALKMERGTGFLEGRDGLIFASVLALYTHVHAEGTPQWAECFVRTCRNYKRGNTG